MISEDEGRASKADPSRFQFTGGLLERSMYVERAGDRQLPQALLAGDYCHILAPRQIGKTSLCFRAARELSRRRVRCALVDVTAAGTPATAEDWYFGLVDEIARRLRLPDPLERWQQRAAVAPAQRFRDFVRALVEEDPDSAPLVIFLDEIEAVRYAPVDADDFLLIVRSFHEERGQSPALQKLRFCLIGVTTPNDLIKNKSVTPFNVSKPIRIDDFTRAECDTLASGLEELDADTGALLDAVYGWTDGHPYMTMRACFEIAQRKQVTRGQERAAVDAIVREVFLERPLEDTNMNYAARRFVEPKFERDGARLADKIQLYRTVLAHKDPPAHNESDVQMELRICGMVKDVEVAPGKRVLRPRNRIYEQSLDAEWLRSKGERRFISEAVWKWLDADKDDAALLRGVVLEMASAWARTNTLSEDEQAFLDASKRYETHALDETRARITQEVARVQTTQKEVGDELTKERAELAKTRAALAKATAEKAEAEAESEKHAAALETIKGAYRATKRWVSLAVSGVALSAVLAGVVVWRTGMELRDQQTDADRKVSEAQVTAQLAQEDAQLAQEDEEKARLARDDARDELAAAVAAAKSAEAERVAAAEEAAKNRGLQDRAKKLEDENASLKQEQAKLRTRKVELETQTTTLAAQKKTLEDVKGKLEDRNKALESDKAKLLTCEVTLKAQTVTCDATKTKLDTCLIGRADLEKKLEKWATPPPLKAPPGPDPYP